MNRRTLHSAVPIVYGIVVVVMWLTVKGTVATVVSVVGAMLVGLYFVVDRRTVPSGPTGPDQR